MRLLITSLVLGSLALASLGGCTADAEQEDANGGASATTADPRPGLSRDAQSLILKEGGKETAIGAPAKIAAALKAIEGRLTVLPAAPRCGPPRFMLTVMDAEAKTAATLSACEANKAFLQVGRDWFEVPLAEPALRKPFAAKAALGDMLLPATNVVLGTTEGAGETQPAASFKKGLDLDAQPATRTASEVPKCAPLMTLRFIDGKKKDVGTVAVFCPKNENDTEAPASLTMDGKLVGWVTFDIAKSIGSF